MSCHIQIQMPILSKNTIKKTLELMEGVTDVKEKDGNIFFRDEIGYHKFYKIEDGSYELDYEDYKSRGGNSKEKADRFNERFLQLYEKNIDPKEKNFTEEYINAKLDKVEKTAKDSNYRVIKRVTDDTIEYICIKDVN